MKIIKPYFEILTSLVELEIMLRRCEIAGRVCYKSENSITDDSYKKFLASIIKRHHESVLEHCIVSVRVVCDRGITHEWVRHRVASYSQESTRYCNYQKDKFGNEITVIMPPFDETKDGLLYTLWKHACIDSEKKYFEMIRHGATTQIARGVLPTSLKTEVIVTMNLREWRHFFKLRTAQDAHPQMRELTIPMLEEFKALIPIVFDNI